MNENKKPSDQRIAVGFPSRNPSGYAIVLTEMAFAFGVAKLIGPWGQQYAVWIFLSVLLILVGLTERFACTTFVVGPRDIKIHLFGVLSTPVELTYDEIVRMSFYESYPHRLVVALRTGAEVRLGPWGGSPTSKRVHPTLLYVCDRLPVRIDRIDEGLDSAQRKE